MYEENERVIRHTKPAKNNLKLNAFASLTSAIPVFQYSSAITAATYLLAILVEPSSRSFFD